MLIKKKLLCKFGVKDDCYLCQISFHYSESQLRKIKDNPIELINFASELYSDL